MLQSRELQVISPQREQELFFFFLSFFLASIPAFICGISIPSIQPYWWSDGDSACRANNSEDYSKKFRVGWKFGSGPSLNYQIEELWSGCSRLRKLYKSINPTKRCADDHKPWFLYTNCDFYRQILCFSADCLHQQGDAAHPRIVSQHPRCCQWCTNGPQAHEQVIYTWRCEWGFKITVW